MSTEYHWSGVLTFLRGQQERRLHSDWALERVHMTEQLHSKQLQLQQAQALHLELKDRVRKLESALRQERFKCAQIGHHRVSSDELVSSLHKQKEQPRQRRSQRPRLSEPLEPEPRPSLEEEPRPATKWHLAASLRSHMDGVRALHFLSNRLTLVSASEDYTVKAWNLEGMAGQEEGLEPYVTLRGHNGPVLALTGAHEFGLGQIHENAIYSGDTQGVVKLWDIQTPGALQPYAAWSNPNVHTWQAHTDAIWSLTHHSIDCCLLSLGADGCAKIWKTRSLDEYKRSSWRRTSEQPIFSTVETDTPTACCWVHTHPPTFAIGSNSQHIRLHNRDTGQSSTISFTASESALTTCLASSFLSPIILSGHEDRRIRLFDLTAGRCVQEIVSHTEGVSALSVHSSGLYLVSGGHDGSLRSWDLRRLQCVQELPAHRRKYDEAVHCIAHAPSERLMASGGADSIVKVFR